MDALTTEKHLPDLDHANLDQGVAPEAEPASAAAPIVTPIKAATAKLAAALDQQKVNRDRNLEALKSSMAAASLGVQALSSQVAAYAFRCALGNVEQFKALAAAKTIKEGVDIQIKFAGSSVQTYLAEVGHASETMATALKDEIGPFNARFVAIASASAAH